MLDILLLALQVITIILLFLFIWWVVQSARGDLLAARRAPGPDPGGASPGTSSDAASWEAPYADHSGAVGERQGEPPAGAADWAVPAAVSPPSVEAFDWSASAGRPVPAPPTTVEGFEWSASPGRSTSAPGPASDGIVAPPRSADTPAGGGGSGLPPASVPSAAGTGPAASGAAVPSPRLVVERSPSLQPGTEIPLRRRLGIGRSPESDLVLADPFVSSTHARIVRREQGYVVEDLGSKNGTFLDERPVDEALLTPEARLRIGDTVFRFRE